MKIATSRFGDMEIPKERIIQIPEGIMGFPDDKRYVVLEHDTEGTPFKWLQSVDSEGLAFIVIDPRLIVTDYRLEYDEETLALFGAIVPDDFIPMVIINVPKDNPIEMTANMKAPIIVNEPKLMGRQVIMKNDAYMIAHRIFPDPTPEENGGQGGGAESEAHAESA